MLSGTFPLLHFQNIPHFLPPVLSFKRTVVAGKVEVIIFDLDPIPLQVIEQFPGFLDVDVISWKSSKANCSNLRRESL